MLKILFKHRENEKFLTLGVLELCLTQALDQVANSASDDFAAFALIQLLLLDVLDQVCNLPQQVTRQ